MKHQKIILMVGGMVVIAAVGFFIGQQYEKRSSLAAQTGGRAGQFAAMGSGAMPGGAGARRTMTGEGGLVAGEIIGKDATSVTIKLRDGSSKIVFYGASTKVMKSAQGSADDVRVGEQVTIVGVTNTDGSITAQSIQLRPADN